MENNIDIVYITGLFHKAVLMGAYLQTPVVPHEETNEHHAREVAVSLGYEGDVRDHKKLLSFLKKQPIEPMIKKLRPLQKSLQKVTTHSYYRTFQPQLLVRCLMLTSLLNHQWGKHLFCKWAREIH